MPRMFPQCIHSIGNADRLSCSNLFWFSGSDHMKRGSIGQGVVSCKTTNYRRISKLNIA